MAISAPGGLVPDVAPSTQGVAGPELNVPVDAFGGAIGHALVGMGEAVQGAGDKIWQRAMDLQNLDNETKAKDADAQYMMQSGKLHADFINKEGLNAGPQALENHIKELQDLRTNIRQGLNPMAAKMYDASSLNFMGRNIFNAAGHSGQQMKVAANNASNSRIDLAQTSTGDNPTDEVQVQRNKRVIETEVEAQGRNNGWAPETIEATKADKVSQANAHRIVGLAKTDAIGAQTMLDNAIKNKAIKPQDAERVQGTVQGQFRDQGSRIIADRVLADRRNGADGEDEKTEDDYVQAGLAEAAKLKSSDPLFPDFVRDRIITNYKKQKMIETDTNNQNKTIIGKAMMKANQEGMLPTTIEELKAIDPAVSSAWDQLGRSPQTQHAIMKQLQTNATIGARAPITPENLGLFHTYKGQAISGDDNVRAGFMAKDFASDPKLAISQKNTLMNIQDRMRKQSSDDPRVARALRILSPDLADAGVNSKTNATDYHQFTGALSDALEQFQTDHPGKTPTLEEVQTIGRQVLQEQNTHWWQSHEAFYQQTAPADVREELRNDPAWKAKGIIPNDSMLDRIYRAKLFRERYGGSAPASKEKTNFPPNAPPGPVSQ